jgi:ankyrin repeat protein
MEKLLSIIAALAFPAAAAANGVEMFQAIRNGDVAFVKAHVTKADIEARDPRGATPLMHAAAFGNLETLRTLIDAGVDVNASNDSNATALLWAARNPDKARLLIERGANPNAQSKQGRTPLMIASMHGGGSAIVALLLSKGADVNVRDRFGVSALNLAAWAGHVDIMRLLLAKGADPNVADITGRSSLLAASLSYSSGAVQLLLQNGADVHAATSLSAGAATRTINNIKNGPPNNAKVTALHNAAAYGPVESVRHLLKAGARVNARDSRNLSPLFFALATEYPSKEIVRTLIGAGADVNAPDSNGETPLDWAEKFGYPDIIAELKKAGAKQGVKYAAPKHPVEERPQAWVALQRTVKLLETTSATFFKGSGCVACHHQPLVARAQFYARAAGISIAEKGAKEQTVQIKSLGVGLTEEYLQAIIPGGGATRLAEMLLGLRASEVAADGVTDAAVVAIAESQETDGHWHGGEVQNRPPLTQSHFAATARCIRALQAYSIPARKEEFTERIGRARAWLVQAKPVTTEDIEMRLSGLVHSAASTRDINDAARALLALQHSDGGWGGNPYMTSDAYATGGALVALSESKVVRVTDRPYQRGVEYLLSTQFVDGSWHVRSRAIKFQPYFESGFPFGHDQWISVAATARAAQALALSIQGSTVTSAPTGGQ